MTRGLNQVMCLFCVLFPVQSRITQLTNSCFKTMPHCYGLYHSDDRPNWKEASKFCRSAGHSLATIPNDATQDFLRDLTRNFSQSEKNLKVWVGGRRSFNTSWTRVNGAPYQKPIKDRDVKDWYATTKITGKGQLNGVHPIKCSPETVGLPALCEHTAVRKSNGDRSYVVSNLTFGSWSAARQYCTGDLGGDLASSLVSSTNQLPPGQYWLGITRRPWLWITPEGTEEIMKYTSWVRGEGDNCDETCLALDLNEESNWTDLNCETEKHNYFICKLSPQHNETNTSHHADTSPPTSTPESTVSGNKTPRSNTVYYVFAGCVPGLILLIVLIVVFALKRLKKKRSLNLSNGNIENRKDPGSRTATNPTSGQVKSEMKDENDVNYEEVMSAQMTTRANHGTVNDPVPVNPFYSEPLPLQDSVGNSGHQVAPQGLPGTVVMSGQDLTTDSDGDLEIVDNALYGHQVAPEGLPSTAEVPGQDLTKDSDGDMEIVDNALYSS